LQDIWKGIFRKRAEIPAPTGVPGSPRYFPASRVNIQLRREPRFVFMVAMERLETGAHTDDDHTNPD
jgi:hypothetical protein